MAENKDLNKKEKKTKSGSGSASVRTKAGRSKGAESIEAAELTAPRMREKYRSEVVPALMKEFGYKNVMQVPSITKIVINAGLGRATQNIKIIDQAMKDIAAITGQKPLPKKSKMAISNFKLRAGLPIGVMVTLRGAIMYEFLDRLISLALPRIRDFRGISDRGFDGRGNFTMGLKDQLVFPEVEYDSVDGSFGMNISVVTTAKTDEEGLALLKNFGFPFRKRQQQQKAA
jgi:large subunit ribosomal protein L5